MFDKSISNPVSNLQTKKKLPRMIMAADPGDSHSDHM
jgi:hypothetical protein